MAPNRNRGGGRGAVQTESYDDDYSQTQSHYDQSQYDDDYDEEYDENDPLNGSQRDGNDGRPKVYIVCLQLIFLALATQLIFVGQRNWKHDCEYALNWWAVLMGSQMLMGVLVHFFFFSFFSLTDRNGRRPLWCRALLGWFIFACFALGVIGCVWTFQPNLDCRTVDEELYTWCFATCIIFIIVYLAWFCYLAQRLFSNPRAGDQLKSGSRTLLDIMNNPVWRICCYILMIACGVGMCVFCWYYYDTYCTSAQCEMQWWFIAASGVFFIFGGFAGLLLEFAFKRLQGKAYGHEQEEVDRYGDDQEEDEQLSVEENKKYSKPKGPVNLRTAGFWAFLVIFAILLLWGCYAYSNTTLADSEALVIGCWSTMGVIVLFALYMIVYIIVRDVIEKHAHRLVDGARSGMTKVGDNRLNLFTAVFFCFAVSGIFVVGHEWDREVDQPFREFSLTYNILWILLCLLVFSHERYSLLYEQDNMLILLRILLGTVGFLTFVWGGLGCVWYFSSSTCKREFMNLALDLPLICDWVQAEIVIYIILFVLTGIFFMASFHQRIRRHNLSQRMGSVTNLFPTGRENMMCSLLIALLMSVLVVFLSGFYWDKTCDQPLREWLLAFGLTNTLLLTLALFNECVKAFELPDYENPPGYHTFKFPRIVLAFFCVSLFFIGIFWWVTSDDCDTNAEPVFVWTFIALLAYLAVFTIILCAFCFFKTGNKDEEGDLPEDGQDFDNLPQESKGRRSIVQRVFGKKKKLYDEEDEEVEPVTLKDRLRRGMDAVRGQYRKKTKSLSQRGWEALVFLVSLVVIVLFCGGIIFVAAWWWDTSCDQPLQVYMVGYGVGVFDLVVFTILLKYYEVRNKNEFNTMGTVLRVPQLVLSVFCVFWSIYGGYIFFKSSNCEAKLPEVFDTTMMCLFSIGIFVLFVAIVYLFTLKKWDHQDEELAEDEYVQPTTNLFPVSATSIVNHTFFGVLAAYCITQAVRHWSESCDEPIREFVFVEGIIMCLLVLGSFLNETRKAFAQDEDDIKLWKSCRPVLVLCLVFWGCMGMWWFFETANCDEDSTTLYYLTLYSVVVFSFACCVQFAIFLHASLS